MLDAVVAHAGLGDVGRAGLHVARQDVVFVSSNGFDICGARRFGFTTVWLKRAPPEDAIAPDDPSQLCRLSFSARTAGRNP